MAQQANVYYGVGITLAVISGLSILIVLICCKTIRIAVNVFKQSMVCIGKIPIIFVFPIFSIIFIILHLAWSVVASYFMYLTGTYDSSINAFSFETVTRDSEELVVR